MRVTIRSDERGVVGAIAALLVTAMLAMSAVVIDVGHSWQQRRMVVTATDAAALAATRDFVEGLNGCSTTADNYVVANNSAASLTGCVHHPRSGGDPGWVNVSAEVTVDFIFAPVFGVGDTTIQSSTTVSYDSAGAVEGGLRPFGLCLDTLNDFVPPPVPGDGIIYRIPFEKDEPSNCAGDEPVPGNWGLFDFDGGNNSENDLRDWTENGYDDEVSIGDSIEGNPGAFTNSLGSALDALLLIEPFAVPIYDTATENGANAIFDIVSFASVRLDGYRASGAEKHRYIDVEFLDSVVQGSGGGPVEDLGAFVIAVCAVDGVDHSTTCT